MFKSYTSNDNLLLPPCLGDFIPQNDPVRVVHRIIEQISLEELYRKYSVKGCSAYHPRMMLQILVYAYLRNIYSSRRIEEFCLKVGFNERQTATLISGKPLFYEGELYSEEHRRKFMTERAGFQVVKDPADKSKLALAINGQVIGEWFKEQFDRLFSSIRKTVISPRKNKGIGL